MRRAALFLPLLLTAAGACQPPTGSPVLVTALADRFGPVEQEPAFEALRTKLARSALVPSRVFDDKTAWTMRGDDWRAVELTGQPAGGAYRIGVRGEAPPLAAPGQYRGRVQLRRLAGGRFEWSASDELAVGGVRLDALAGALDALFRGAQGTTEAGARAAIAEAVPRASARLGRLVRLETLSLQPDASGATFVVVSVRVTPDGIRGFAPRYAAFLDKYARTIRTTLAVADLEGATWWTLDAADHLWTVRLRLREGSLVPLDGPAEGRLPARLRATGDYVMKMGRFKVGAKQIQAEVSLTREPGEKGFTLRFVKEPDWQLPFLVEPLLDAPLRTPFEWPGSEVAWTASETGEGTILAARSRTRVRETWLLRWLGGMVDEAAGEFRKGAEREADQFHREWLLALRDDLAAHGAAP